MSTDLIGAAVGLALTVMILSYVLGDNPLFRIAMYLFVGVAAGYAVVVAVQNVLIPQLVAPVLALGSQTADVGALTLLGFSWLLALLFLLKLHPANQIGRIPLALLAGVGAAVAIGGAVTGTLLPQTAATAFPLQLSNLGALATSLIVAGVTTNCCVETTAREAVMRGFHLVVAEDCVAVKDHLADLHRATLESLGLYFGLVRPSDVIMAQWAQSEFAKGTVLSPA